MWPQSLGDPEVLPSQSQKPPGGYPQKRKGPSQRKTYNFNRKGVRLSSHGSLTSVTSGVSEGDNQNQGIRSGHDSTNNSGHSGHNSGHSTLDVDHSASFEKPANETHEDLQNDFDLQPDHKVKWRSFDIMEGVVSFETDYENTRNQMECESKQKRQRKAKKRYKRNKLRKKFTYTFLRPKHYKPLIDDPDAFEEIKAIEEEFERRRQESLPLLQSSNRKVINLLILKEAYSN